MGTNDETLFEAFLNQHDEEAWPKILATLLPEIHEVDRTATQIWFHFFPLALARALEQAEDAEELARTLLLEGKYQLKDQIDSSHTFFYGHRYWPEIKRAVVDHASSTQAPASLELAEQIRQVARSVARRIEVDEALVVGLTAAAFMTLQQVGMAAFKASPGTVNISHRVARMSPEQVLKVRKRDDRQGWLSFLRGPWKRFTATFNEADKSAKFKLIETQHLTTAAMFDKRDHHLRDPRCIAGEGPIPVQCRSASCGTCWVGVLGGAEKLSEVARLERQKMRDFGYIESDDPKPVIRLACQAQAFGNLSIVIPPWNGIFGQLLRKQRAAKAEVHKTSNS